MATLKPIEKAQCEKLFQMGDGYVCDFSNSTFGAFVCESIGVDVYDSFSSYNDHSSKAKKLRHLWSVEENSKVGKLLLDLCDYVEANFIKYNSVTSDNSVLLSEVRIIGARLRGEYIEVSLPKVQEETLESLMTDIKSSLDRNAPEFVLDRLHTFASKMLRQICTDKGIAVTDPKGNNLPLHSLIGMLSKHYGQNPTLKSDFSVLAVKTSISLFEKYNEVRNHSSYAHDNDVLEKLEAEYAVRIMSATLSFIDNIERHLKKIAEKAKREVISNFDNLPF